MSLGHGASIVRDGLVFCYDQGNIQKSWKGAPATNLFTETNLNSWSISGAAISTSQYVTPFDDAAYAITDSNTGAYSNIDRNTTVANNSASYTISLMVRKTYGATSATLGFNIGFNGGTQVALSPRFNSDTGVGYGNSVDFGDWWYWYFTITNNNSGNTNLYCQFFPATGVHNGSDNTIGVGTAIIGSMMLVAGSVAARFVNGTRSNAQALLDLTRQNTITTNLLTYASNNTFSFDGVDDRLESPAAGILNTDGPVTMTSVFKRNSGSTGTLFRMKYGNESSYSLLLGTTPIVQWWDNANVRQTITSAATINANQIYHLTAIINPTAADTNTVQFYLNGVFVDSFVVSGSSRRNHNDVMYIGSGLNGDNTIVQSPLNGDIYVTMLHKKALTAAEVKQNFEAIRGRYGI
jgi:hypothetical protein